MEEIEARLKHLRAGGTSKTAPNQENDVPVLVVDPKYADLPDLSNLTDQMVPVKTTFNDDEYLNEPGVLLQAIDDQTTARIGRKVIPMLSCGFSPRGAAAMFVLAYQLKNPSNGSRVFSGADDVAHIDDKPWDDFSDTISFSPTGSRPEPETLVAASESEIKHEASVYAYIAASTLRMCTKSEENYIKAYTHIINGYQRFYGIPCRIQLPTPMVDALKTLSCLISQAFKYTLFRILYIGSGDGKCSGLKRFLYEIHLENTGLHIVSIFDQLCRVLDCKPAVLLSAINSPRYERQIKALRQMLKLGEGRPENARKMWRFGGIYDDAFMYHLRTKTCPSLTYVLASALKIASPDRNQGILNIKRLQDVSPEKRRMFDEVAKIIVRDCRNKSLPSSSSTLSS